MAEAFVSGSHHNPELYALHRPSSIFVGREHELSELLAGLEEAASGRSGICLIAGAPGMGKTRLCIEFEALAIARTAKVLWGRCAQAMANAPPCWPWVQIIRECLSHFEPQDQAVQNQLFRLSKAFETLPREYVSLAEEPPPAAPGPCEPLLRLFGATATLFSRLSRSQTLVVILDNLHAADQLSALALHLIARRLCGARILFVCTYRDGELRKSPLPSKLVADLAFRGARQIFMRGLDSAGVGRLVEASTGGAPEDGLLESISEGCGGNPLLLEIMLRHRLDLDLEPKRKKRVGISPSLREALSHHFAPLSSRARSTLTAAAIIGREFEFETLRSISDHCAEELIDTIAELEDAGLVRETADRPGRYRFVHGLVREFIYADVTMTMRPWLAYANHRHAAALPFCNVPQAGEAEFEREPPHTNGFEPAGLSSMRNGSGASDSTKGNQAWSATVEKVFRRQGDYWTIAYEGRTLHLKHSKGLACIAYLLAHPVQEFLAPDVAAAVANTRPDLPVVSRGDRKDLQQSSSAVHRAAPLLDPAAKAAYRRRLGELRDELEEARSFSDLGRTSKIEQEFEFVANELARAEGFNGRDRKWPSETEKARVSITNAIRAAVRRIAKEHLTLGRYLRTTIKTGYFCSFDPDPRFPGAWNI